MARGKGTNILNLRSYIVERFGDHGWSSVIATLSADDRVAIEGVLAVGWHELALMLRLYGAFDDVLGVADPHLVEHFGAYAAEHDLTRIHRLFLRMANPAYVIEKGGEYWHRFFDTGTWHVVRETPTSATATLAHFGAVDARFCRMLTAYLRRMFELVGAKAVKVDHAKCRARGDDACVFVGVWKE